MATQLMRQTLLVCGFQQARTEDSVNFDGTADHATGKIVEFHLRITNVWFLCVAQRFYTAILLSCSALAFFAPWIDAMV